MIDQQTAALLAIRTIAEMLLDKQCSEGRIKELEAQLQALKAQPPIPACQCNEPSELEQYERLCQEKRIRQQ